MVLAVTVVETLRIPMQGGCPVAVGMARGLTLSRTRCRRVAPPDPPPLIRTSRTHWVRTSEADNHYFEYYDKFRFFSSVLNSTGARKKEKTNIDIKHIVWFF